MTARYLAVPVKTKTHRPDGWRVFQLPIGNRTPAAGTFRGPLAGWRAQRRAAALNRKG